MGPCLCGDLYCGSCGPAQGNHRCGNCGEWEEEHGEPESEHDDAKCSEAMRLQAEADYQWELEMEKSEAEYERWLAENPRV